MLETIREYAWERLEESGEAYEIRQLHANYVLMLAAQAESALRVSDDIQWLRELEPEQDNVRAALVWLRQTERVGEQLDLVGRISKFWGIRGVWLEGLRWSEEALAGNEGERSARRAQVLHQAGLFAWSVGEWDRARLYMEDGLSISREFADHSEIARVLTNLGTLAMNLGHDAEAAPLLEEAALHARRADEPGSVAAVTGNFGALAARANDKERAITLFEKALAIDRELGRSHQIAWWLSNLAECLRDTERAEEAVAFAKESVAVAHTLGDAEALVYTLNVLGSLAQLRGSAEISATLVGVVDALRERTGHVYTDLDQGPRDEELRRVLGQERYEAIVVDGQSMSLDDAVQYALASID